MNAGISYVRGDTGNAGINALMALTPGGGKAAQAERLAINAEKGAQAEKIALEAEQLTKNNQTFKAVDPKTGQTGGTIPDSVRETGQTVDVKNVQKLSDSKQLRLQTEVSAQSGQKAQVISTNPNAKISSTVKKRMDVKTPPNN